MNPSLFVVPPPPVSSGRVFWLCDPEAPEKPLQFLLSPFGLVGVRGWLSNVRADACSDAPQFCFNGKWLSPTNLPQWLRSARAMKLAVGTEFQSSQPNLETTIGNVLLACGELMASSEGGILQLTSALPGSGYAQGSVPIHTLRVPPVGPGQLHFDAASPPSQSLEEQLGTIQQRLRVFWPLIYRVLQDPARIDIQSLRFEYPTLEVLIEALESRAPAFFNFTDELILANEWTTLCDPKTLPNVRLLIRSRKNYNLSVAHAGVPFVETVLAFNKGVEESHQAVLRFELCDLRAEEFRLPSLKPREVRRLLQVGRPELLDHGRLVYPGTSRSLQVYLHVNGRFQALRNPIFVELHPDHSWLYHEQRDALAAFIETQDAKVLRTMLQALESPDPLVRLVAARAHKLASSPDPAHSQLILEMIYDTLRLQGGVTYAFEDNYHRTDEKRFQLIRRHTQVLGGKGTCIDLALLIAACLRHFHKSPIIALLDPVDGVPRHALIGVRCTQGGPSPESISSQEKLLDAIDSKDLLVVEPTGIAQNTPLKLTDAQKRARKQMRELPLHFTLDVDAAFNSGVIPVSGSSRAGFVGSLTSEVRRMYRSLQRYTL